MKRKKGIAVVLSVLLSFSAFSSIGNAVNSGDESNVKAITTMKEYKDLSLQVLDKKDQKGQKIGYKIKMNLPNVLKGTKKNGTDEYDSMSITGWASQSEIGKPDVPVKPILFEIPENKEATVSIVSKSETKFDKVNLWPVQEAVSDDNKADKPTFKKDVATYSKNAVFPKSNIVQSTVIKMRNHKVLEVVLTPLQANPVQKTVMAAGNLELEVSFTDAAPKASAVMDSPTASSSYDAAVGSGIYGFSAVSSYSQPVNGLERYMIIMDDQFLGNQKLQEFIQWKNEKGNEVSVVKTSEINSNGAPTYTEIQSFLRSKIATGQYPTYLLLVGDSSDANGVATKLEGDPLATTNWVTDLPLTLADDTDYVPDLFCGRLPATDNDQLTTMLTKVINMDKTPSQGSMYDKVMVASEVENLDSDNYLDRNYCETADAVASYFEQNAGGRTYDCTRAIVNAGTDESIAPTTQWRGYMEAEPDPMPILWYPSSLTDVQPAIGDRIYNSLVTNETAVSNILNKINRGCALVLHRGHGNATYRVGGRLYPSGWSTPSFTVDNLLGLNNGEMLPLVLSINCFTGSFQKGDANFSKQLLINPNGGAYAAIGATTASPTEQNDWFTHGLMMSFLGDYSTWHNNSTYPDWTGSLPAPAFGAEGSVSKLGPMLNFGKSYVLQHYSSSNDAVKGEYKMYHLLGDPEGNIQLHTPIAYDVTYPSALNFGTSTVVVNTPIDNMEVCLYSEALGIHQKIISSGGKAEFVVNPQAAGSIIVTATGAGVRPYQGTITVKAANDGICYVKAKSLTSLKDGDTVRIKNNGGGSKTIQWYLSNLRMHLKLTSSVDDRYNVFNVKKYAEGTYGFYKNSMYDGMNYFMYSDASKSNVDVDSYKDANLDRYKFNVSFNTTGDATLTDIGGRVLRGSTASSAPYLGTDPAGATVSSLWIVKRGVNHTVAFRNDSQSGGVFNSTFTIKNTGDMSITNWKLEFDFPYEITSVTNAKIYSHVGTHYSIGYLSTNTSIAAGATLNFQVSGNGTWPSMPTTYNLTSN